jgi:Macrocin-O-methyltransferase (TylF)
LEENGRVQSRARLVTLDSFVVEQGFCRIAASPEDAPGDSGGVSRSALRLFEDGVELCPSRSPHADIRRLGGGRFSHWGTEIYFSSSDGSPPESNGRSYQALVPATDRGANMLLSMDATIDFEALSVDQRYAEIERLAAVLAPGEHLSEIKRSMFLDKEFRQDFEKFSEGIYRSYDRKFLMREFARLTMGEEGHFAECGVYKGASAYILAKELKNAKSSKKLHLYDSFEGLSAPAAIDGGHWTRGDLLGGLEEVENNLRGMATHIVFHKGWIPEAFDKDSEDSFSFVHIDVDLHQPTLDALAYFYPRMSRHGVILCDDYGFETCPGARKACDDFFKATGDVVLHLPTGQGLVICGLPKGRRDGAR